MKCHSFKTPENTNTVNADSKSGSNKTDDRLGMEKGEARDLSLEPHVRLIEWQRGILSRRVASD